MYGLTGNVPKGYAQAPVSLEGQGNETWTWTQQDEGEAEVATDGGCHKTPVGQRAGWGYASRHLQIGTRHGPAKGPWQTAQRGEVLSVAHDLNNAPCRIHLHTDGKYVATTLGKK